MKFSISNVGDVNGFRVDLEAREHIQRKKRNLKGGVFAGRRPVSLLGGDRTNWQTRQSHPSKHRQTQI